MGSLLIDSLQIQRYRGFKELEIPRLGRLNLITGRNNTGKTSILEAIRILAHRSVPPAVMGVLVSILETREELRARATTWASSTPEDGSDGLSVPGVHHLFFDRSLPSPDEPPIRIGTVDKPNLLEIGLEWYESTERGGLQGNLDLDEQQTRTFQPALTIRSDGSKSVRFPLSRIDQPGPPRPGLRYFPSPHSGRAGCVFVASREFQTRDIGRLWDAISLTPDEDTVVEALRLISPEVERIALGMPDDSRSPLPVRAKLQGAREPVPLKSLGEGLHRIFAIALALVNARDGVLLLDEVENGLHYTVQTDLWRLIARVAADLNVQVFATTHSHDCLLAFEQAARESPEEGIVTRLQRNQDRVRVTSFDEPELAIVAREAIEIR